MKKFTLKCHECEKRRRTWPQFVTDLILFIAAVLVLVLFYWLVFCR